MRRAHRKGAKTAKASTRLAVFSDVHANLPALKAVLRILGKRRIRQIYCLGDLIGRGPFPSETLDLLRSNKVKCARGSTDARFLEAKRKVKGSTLETWTSQQLTEQDLAFIKRLPDRLRIDAHGTSVLMVHGSPSSEGNIIEDSDIEELNEMLSKVGCEVLIGGGADHPFARHLQNGWVVNCGSVGVNANGAGIASFAVVVISPSGAQIAIEQAPYSRETLLRAAVARNFPLQEESIVGSPASEQDSPEGFVKGVNLALRSVERSFSKALAAALAQQSPERVRDLRIAASRLVQALDLFSPLPKQRSLIKALKGIRKTAGELRELDILLGHVVSAARELGNDHSDGLAGFLDELAARRETAKSALAKKLEQNRGTRLARALKESLESGSLKFTRRGNGIDPSRGNRSNAYRVIKKIASRAAQDLERTHNVLQLEEFHDLRITCKRLRYALELLQDVSGADYSAEISSLRDFQKLMGGIHDFDTSTELIARLQHRLRRKLSAENLRAADLLAFVFQKQRTELFGRFLELSHDFAASGFFQSLIPDRPHP